MEKKLSENISEFINFLTASKQLCEFCKVELDKQDKLTQDILHSMELGNLTYSERAKLATRLAVCRKDRRYYKDRIEELEPVREYLETNKKAYNELTRLLGTVRKIERYHSNRTYRPKVMDFEPIVTEETK